MFDYRRLIILTVCFLCLVGVANAQGPGQGIFERRCARCHGADATGGESGPNIISQLTTRNNQELEAFIRAGRVGSGMPAFDLPLHQMADLVSYLRVLAPTSRAQTLTVVRKRIQTTDGQTIEGQVLSAGLTDLQLRTDDMKVRLLRKAERDQYRLVTSQQDWRSYDGDFSGNRYSTLTQIDRSNAGRLTTRWIFQVPGVPQVENTPIVVQGIMYISSVNECWAVDAGTGRTIWHYQRPRTKGHFGNASKGIHRGVAWAGDRIFQLTDNAHLIALNRFNGELLWETEMADWRQNYDGTSAPLAVGNLVISGIGGGDAGVRGFVAAYDQSTGKEAWRFWTVPRPGEPGSETWTGKEIEHRAGATWLTGSYDPQLDTVYWAVGNPGPDFDGDERKGDNLYTDSVVALDAKTGRLKWYYQFTPHDTYDWDAQEPLALVDTIWRGQARKLLIQANRNGFFYVLDRTDGKLLLAKSFLKNLNWAERIGSDGRPVLKPLPQRPDGESYVCPGFQGGTNWFSTSYNPTTGFYYFNALERCNLFSVRSGEWEPGNTYLGGAARSAPGETFQKVLRAVNIETGEIAWELLQTAGSGPASAGVLSTASGVVFFGENSGAVMAVDASNGKTLWQFPTNYPGRASPMTYMFDNKQYVAIAVGQDIIAFSLPD
jgi:alcohol dehydrogenase (cytochrome c)